MGKVTEDVKLTSYDSLRDFKNKIIKEAEIKSLYLQNVIVDSGATLMCLSKKLIEKLGLEPLRTVKVNTADGIKETTIYGPVLIEIKDRVARQDVMELKHPGIDALIGQLPLEQLDFLINPSIQRLIPNPEHDNQMILDQLIVSEDYKYEIRSDEF
jgi:predicted aspartyl protease